jgi:L-asparaginase
MLPARPVRNDLLPGTGPAYSGLSRSLASGSETITSVTSTLITTGGTMAFHQGDSRMLSGSELAISAGVDFDKILDLRSAPSWDLTLDDMVEVAAVVRRARDAGSHEIVVTHGTDTMEETAWLTDLLLGSDRRSSCGVVFTGAMRFADHPGSDGPSNLVDALAAAKERRHSSGVRIAFAGRTHAARWARKVDAEALDAFDSQSRPSSSGPLPPTNSTIDRSVALIKTNPIANQAIPPDIHGLVLEGTGAGHVSSHYHREIERLLSAGVPVIIATRCRGANRTPQSPSDVMRAGDLTAEKAALALMTALAISRDLDDVRAWWSQLCASSIR